MSTVVATSSKKLLKQQLRKEAAQAIKRQLPQGSMAEIARRSGKTFRAVWDIMEGKYYNEDVVNIAKEMIQEFQADRTAIIKTVDTTKKRAYKKREMAM